MDPKNQGLAQIGADPGIPPDLSARHDTEAQDAQAALVSCKGRLLPGHRDGEGLSQGVQASTVIRYRQQRENGRHSTR